MQWLAALRSELASATSVILAEAHPCNGCYSDARTDPATIRLHPSKIHFDEMVAIPVVFKQPVESKCTLPGVLNSVFHQDVEKSIIVIIRPCRDLMCRGRHIILERHALRGCHVDKCAVPVVVVKEIGISDPN